MLIDIFLSMHLQVSFRENYLAYLVRRRVAERLLQIRRLRELAFPDVHEDLIGLYDLSRSAQPMPHMYEGTQPKTTQTRT